MDKQQYYAQLELDPKCSLAQIKTQYKKLALKWHPDKNPQDPERAKEKFQKVSEAYNILSNPKKREHYDKYGSTDEDQFDIDSFMQNFTFEDIMGTMMSDIDMEFQTLFTSFMGPGMNKRNKKKKFAKSRTTNINMEKEFQMFFNSMNQELDKELDKDVFRKKNKKKDKKKEEEDDGWETETDEEEIDDEQAFINAYF